MLSWLFDRLGFGPALALIALALVIAFVLWLAAPLDWRNAEGSVVDDGRRTASWLRWLRWWS